MHNGVVINWSEKVNKLNISFVVILDSKQRNEKNSNKVEIRQKNTRKPTTVCRRLTDKPIHTNLTLRRQNFNWRVRCQDSMMPRSRTENWFQLQQRSSSLREDGRTDVLTDETECALFDTFRERERVSKQIAHLSLSTTLRIIFIYLDSKNRESYLIRYFDWANTLLSHLIFS